MWAAALCLLWGASPVWTWWVSRPRPAREEAALPPAEREYLHGIARDTWRLFERCVGPDDRHLPPDNLQTVPSDVVAHRTSPTNIGLYLLSTACARAFGWIGTQDMLARMEATLTTLHTLQALPLRPFSELVRHAERRGAAAHVRVHRGQRHPLRRLPGRGTGLRGAGACAARQQLQPSAPLQALPARKLAPLLAHVPELFSAESTSALARVLAWGDPLAEAQRNPGEFGLLLAAAGDELAALLPEAHAPAQAALPGWRDELAWHLTDHLSTLGSVLRDANADMAPAETIRRLQALAYAFEHLAWSAEFGFLFHRKRHLFHIGFRVAELQLDASFYDLLASEARLTSLLAIAKGDVAVRHWAALGRPFYAVGALAGLRSWSGSMFEYLMPTLVLDEPHGSVLRDACHAAIHEQIAFAREQHVPWGISESAYAASDHTLAYQYAPQGVPRLALRRTPQNELVIAPYATALAAQLAPRRSAANLHALQTLAARARYGYIEALDFSPARLSGGESFAPVSTFMAHHQGMSLVALANVLLDGPAQRWGMGNAHVEAVASLLHERAPREVSMLYEPLPMPPVALQKRGPRMLREVIPGAAALEPTHVLSNGRYSVSLRANGAGWSRRGATGITRSRDDALRDALGKASFYLRWGQKTHPVSITQHPAPDAQAHYKSTFHADRVSFEATWPELQAQTVVWVSPEDDIEFRQVELRNLSERVIEVELMSAFEVTSLADPRADESHPAFSNLFIRAQWLAAQQALLFERKPRLATEQGLQAAHFLAETDPQVLSLRVQTDRQRWWGRNQAVNRPLASFDDLPDEAAESVTLDTGLDPVCALSVRLRIAPNAKARLTFATTASDSEATLRAVIDKYRQAIHIERASLMSATLTGIRLRTLAVSAENFAAIQMLTTALVQSLTRPQTGPARPEGAAHEVCDRRLLWRFGISGDRPIVLVSAGVTQSLGLLRSLAQALRMWAWGGIACDLVVVNSEPASYLMALHREVAALRERTLAESGAQGGPPSAGFYLLRSDELAPAELSTLQCLARIRLRADGRPLVHHVQEWVTLHEQAFEERHATSTVAVPVGRGNAPPPVVSGDFSAASGEFRFDAGAEGRPMRPWINVLFQPRLRRTGFRSGRWLHLGRQQPAQPTHRVVERPRRRPALRMVSPARPQDAGDLERQCIGVGRRAAELPRLAWPGLQRGAAIGADDLEVTATWCVDAHSAVKQVRIHLVNRGHRNLQLRVIGIAEWVMGESRANRGSVRTSLFSQRLPEHTSSPSLMSTQLDRSAGFGDGTAFLALATAGDENADWTCDRRECFDARGRLLIPDHFGQQQGLGLDPCAALGSRFTLPPGEAVERVFLLGYGDSPAAARASSPRAPPPCRLCNAWKTHASAGTSCSTPPSSRHPTRSLTSWSTAGCSTRHWPAACSQGRLLPSRRGHRFFAINCKTRWRWPGPHPRCCASRSSLPPHASSPRAMCSIGGTHPPAPARANAFLRRPAAAAARLHALPARHRRHHAARRAGAVSRRRGDSRRRSKTRVLRPPWGSTTPRCMNTQHAPSTAACAWAAHGLPLFGTGDWNDGMNRVGHEGRGEESVWLGWFLYQLVNDFAPLARERGDEPRALRWETAARGWRAALNNAAWDGQWFKRAFFDNGEALGSHSNRRGQHRSHRAGLERARKVDPWRCNASPPTSVEEQLVDHEAGLDQAARPTAGAGRAERRLHPGLPARRARERRPVLARWLCGR